MDTLFALFSAFWRYITGASWFQAIQWPFWACLILLALGGIYTARIQKNTLFCRGITGALKLAMIYLFLAVLYKVMPGFMEDFPVYPFLSRSESSLILLNPVGIFDHSFGTVAELYVWLYFLLFLVNIGGSLDYHGKNPAYWAGSQFISCLFATLAYYCCSTFFAKFLGKLSDDTDLFYIIIAIILYVPMFVLMLMKVYFIVFRKAGNPTYARIMQFLTTHKFGTLFSITLFSTLIVVAVLIAVNAWDMGQIRLRTFSWMAYVLIYFMCSLTLYVFSQYYTERKP